MNGVAIVIYVKHDSELPVSDCALYVLYVSSFCGQ